MRDDMNKVVTTRPRYGGKGGARKTYEKASKPREKRVFKGVDVDLRPKQESMRKRHRVNGDSKEFSDLLGPLEGYLKSRAGLPWDDVWSDICSVMKGNGLQAAHIKQHIKWMVGGIPHSGETYFPPDGHGKPGTRYGSCVYVDDDGILRKQEGNSWKRKKETYHYYRESDTVEYHKLNGAWFRVEIGSEQKERRWQGWGGYWHTQKYTHYFAIEKRSLSKKEIKKLKLNDRTETVPPRLSLT